MNKFFKNFILSRLFKKTQKKEFRKKLKKILIISYFYFPEQSAGARRSYALVNQILKKIKIYWFMFIAL